MEDFTIKNSQITASNSWNRYVFVVHSVFDISDNQYSSNFSMIFIFTRFHGPHQARLNLPVGKDGVGAWCVGRPSNEEHLQVGFLKKTIITGIATQGEN